MQKDSHTYAKVFPKGPEASIFLRNRYDQQSRSLKGHAKQLLRTKVFRLLQWSAPRCRSSLLFNDLMACYPDIVPPEVLVAFTLVPAGINMTAKILVCESYYTIHTVNYSQWDWHDSICVYWEYSMTLDINFNVWRTNAELITANCADDILQNCQRIDTVQGGTTW